MIDSSNRIFTYRLSLLFPQIFLFFPNTVAAFPMRALTYFSSFHYMKCRCQDNRSHWMNQCLVLLLGYLICHSKKHECSSLCICLGRLMNSCTLLASFVVQKWFVVYITTTTHQPTPLDVITVERTKT